MKYILENMQMSIRGEIFDVLEPFTNIKSKILHQIFLVLIIACTWVNYERVTLKIDDKKIKYFWDLPLHTEFRYTWLGKK